MFPRSLLLALLFLFNAAFAAERALPYVDTAIDPAKSLHAEHLHYPFPHQFARVQDGQGRNWELAYFDLFESDAAQKAKAPAVRRGDSGWSGGAAGAGRDDRPC